MNKAPICFKCRIPMIRSMALTNAPVIHPDFYEGKKFFGDGCTMTYDGTAQMIGCWKCPSCGKSVQ
jgi:hypothetical protein